MFVELQLLNVKCGVSHKGCCSLRLSHFHRNVPIVPLVIENYTFFTAASLKRAGDW